MQTLKEADLIEYLNSIGSRMVSQTRIVRALCLVSIEFCVCLLGSSQAVGMNAFTPSQDDPRAKNYLDLLLQGKVDQIQRDIDPSVVDLNIEEKLVKIAESLPAETPKSIRVVSELSSEEDGYSVTSTTFACEFQNAWYLVTVTLRKKLNVTTVNGLKVTRSSDSLENLNKFTLYGKSVFQYMVLALASCSLSISLYVFVLCIRTRTGISKWPWMLFILIGVGKIAINWTTAQWTFTILALHVPPAAAVSSHYGPWSIAAYFPLGAILFLNERWREKILGKSLL